MPIKDNSKTSTTKKAGTTRKAAPAKRKAAASKNNPISAVQKKPVTRKKTTSNKSSKKTTGRKTTSRKTSNKKSFKKVFWSWFFMITAVGIILFTLFFITVYLGFWGHIPSERQLESIKTPLASEVYAEDGKLLGRYYIENRTNIQFNEISPNVIHALVATEDARFYEHSGIDQLALLRVLFKSIILGNKSSGGGSTLSQQTAKNLYPRKPGLIMMPANKLREAITAYRLEKIYSKDEILTLYLNTVPFSENIFGIGLASERFFSKRPSQLTVDEAAVLVGMLKANNAYNPRKNPERSKERRNVVIGQMLKEGYLTPEESKFYQAQPLELKYKVISYNSGPAPYFLAMLRPELKKWCEDNIKPNGETYNLYTDGLQIQTTLNYDYQKYAQQAVKEQMEKLQKVFDEHWKDTKPWSDNKVILLRAIKRSERYRNMKKAGANDEQIKQAFATPREMTIFNWDGNKDMVLTPNDSIKHYLMMLQAGFMAIEPQSGKLKAWVGGINFQYFQYDHISAARQVGSTFKPIVYLSGLDNGLKPNQYFSNERKIYKEYQNWSPRNSHPDYTGYYSMSGALAKSVNTVAVDVIMQSGIENTISMAQQLGITADLPEYPSLALGVASISLKEMVTAYATIINDGKYIKPHYLVSIKDAKGNMLAKFSTPLAEKSNINPDHTRAVVQMLKSVIDNGSGKAMRSVWGIAGDLAGKTGTTQNQSDGWFIGANPNIVAGCWVGADEPAIHFRTIRYGQGAYMALPVVGHFFKDIYNAPKYAKLANQHFKLPSAQTMKQLSIEPYIETLPKRQMRQIEYEQRRTDRIDNWKKYKEEKAKTKTTWKERRAQRKAKRAAQRNN
ncbi:MAG: transglycosylase domain-containing protein [Mangrovibacterium sp.]